MKLLNNTQLLLVSVNAIDSNTTPPTEINKVYLKTSTAINSQDPEKLNTNSYFSNAINNAPIGVTLNFEVMLNNITNVEQDVNVVVGADPLMDDCGNFYIEVN